jgi:hypothetical protein
MAYLRANSNANINYRPMHRGMITEVFSNPRRIGITEVLESFQNVRLRQGSSDFGIAQMVFVTGDGSPDQIYLVECGISPDNHFTQTRYKLCKYLRKGYRFFVEEFDVHARMKAVIRKRGTSQLNTQELPRDEFIRQ